MNSFRFNSNAQPANRGSQNKSNAFGNSSNATQKKDFKDYFDDDDDDENSTGVFNSGTFNNANDDDEVDPLDAFMNQVNEQVKKEETQMNTSTVLPEIVSGLDRDYEGYLNEVAVNSAAALGAENLEVDYDSDGMPIGTKPGEDGEKKKIEPLPPIDHSKIIYNSFRKNFYKEDSGVTSMSEDDVIAIRDELEISVLSDNSVPAPRPIRSFKEAVFIFNEYL